MKLTRILLASTAAGAAMTFSLLAFQPRLQAAPAATPAPPLTAPPTTCKSYGAGKCCSPDITLHLAKEAVYSACGESDATFLGEAASKDLYTCKYHFKVAGENADDTFVQVYMNPSKDVPDKPTDPFFSYKKVGKVWMTDKAKSPKAAAMGTSTTGLYMPAKGYYVMVSASNKVCSKNEMSSLAKAMK